MIYKKLDYLKSKQDQNVKNFGMVGMGYVVEVLNDYEQELAKLKVELEEAVDVIKLSKQTLHLSKSSIGYEQYCDSLNKFLAKYRGENDSRKI